MATTIKLAQMSTMKLNALLENASEEDAVAIKAILETRNAAKAVKAAEATTASETASESETTASAPMVVDNLTDEEREAMAAAENGEPSTTEEKKKGGRKASAEKMTEEEFAAKKAECEQNIGHRCKLILNGTAIETTGVITAVLGDKRSMQVYYAVQTDAVEDIESKKVYKKWDATGLEISEEVVPGVAKVGGSKTGGKHRNTERQRKAELLQKDAGAFEAERDAVIALAGENVGKQIILDGGIVGRIFGILVDKRSLGLYYRIKAVDPETGASAIRHKAINYTVDETEGGVALVENPDIQAEFDEEGQKMHDEYATSGKAAGLGQRTVATPEERVIAAEEALKKAEATLAKAQETVASRRTQLKIAKAELANKLNAAEAAVNKAVEETAVEETAVEETAVETEDFSEELS